MPTEIKMPQLSDTMHAGKILAWRKKEGEPIARGDVLAEVETDKANLEIESFQQGVLLKIVAPTGTSASVGDTIALLGTPDEAVSGLSQIEAKIPAPTQITGNQIVGNGVHPQNPQPVAAPVVSSSPLGSGLADATVTERHEDAQRHEGRVRASPLAKKLAQELNIDLSTVRGSGPQGRIIRKDIETAPHHTEAIREESIREKLAPLMPSPEPRPATAPGRGSGRSYPLSKMRETIARRMQESVNQAPHFYVTTSIDMESALELREKLKELPEYSGISVNHLIIKACGLALRREPRVNNCIRDGQVYEPDSINIGIITAIPDGLLIPVIRDVDRLPLKDVVFEARAAVERAKAGRPSSSDLMGGTFSISNMGMFDVENFTAIINPGQGAVLAVSAVQSMPVVRKQHIVIGRIMKVTLSVDHRIIDGVMGASFLKYFKESLEIPGLLLA